MTTNLSTALTERLSAHIELSNSRLETLALLITGMIGARTVNLSHIASERGAPVKVANALQYPPDFARIRISSKVEVASGARQAMPDILKYSKQTRWFLYCVATLLAVLVMIASARAAEPMINTTTDNLAINGYDTVAYFTDGKAKKGSSEHEVTWQDARWNFASAEHRELFEANPSRYAPQFGGWCAAGIANGEYYEVNAEAWHIVDGKLYLNYSRKVLDRWSENRAEKIAKANEVWAERAATN